MPKKKIDPKMTRTIMKKLAASTPEQSLADVLTKAELEQWTMMNMSALRAEARAIPSASHPR
jgi:endonuclease/exonuclease/phosphatase (EEP) superfamily protein YafD